MSDLRVFGNSDPEFAFSTDRDEDRDRRKDSLFQHIRRIEFYNLYLF
jgi:hypothetical protein